MRSTIQTVHYNLVGQLLKGADSRLYFLYFRHRFAKFISKYLARALIAFRGLLRKQNEMNFERKSQLKSVLLNLSETHVQEQNLGKKEFARSFLVGDRFHSVCSQPDTFINSSCVMS